MCIELVVWRWRRVWCDWGIGGSKHSPQGECSRWHWYLLWSDQSKMKMWCLLLKNYCDIQDGKSRALSELQSSLSARPCATAQVTCLWNCPRGWEKRGKDLGTNWTWSEFRRKWIYPISKERVVGDGIKKKVRYQIVRSCGSLKGIWIGKKYSTNIYMIIARNLGNYKKLMSKWKKIIG